MIIDRREMRDRLADLLALMMNQPQHRQGSRCDQHVSTQVFRYRRHPRTRRRGPDLGRLHAAPGLRCRSRVLAAGADGANLVVIGKDTRISGYMFEAALEAGLVAAGVDVRCSGRCRRRPSRT